MFVRMGGERGAAVGLDAEGHQYAVEEVTGLTDESLILVVHRPGSTAMGIAPGHSSPQLRRALEAIFKEWRSQQKGPDA